jgi:hypothetical protein
MEEFDKERVKNLLLQKLNEFRNEKSLHPFKMNELLSKAAQEQAEYNRKFNDPSSEQSSKKKATPFLRVRSYGGMFAEVEEYDLALEVQAKKVLNGSKRKRGPNTYVGIADEVLSEWEDERRLDELLTSVSLYNVGFGIAENKYENSVFVTVVLGSEPYSKKPGFKYHKKSYKVSPYDRNACKKFSRDFVYLRELFSDNLRYEGKKINLYYHDLSLIENLLEYNKNGFAVDILKKDQFTCDGGNSLHPSKVHNGMMLKPIYKKKLLKSNPLEEQKEFVATLGSLPSGLDTNDLELSLIVISDRYACMTIPRNKLNGHNIRLLKINLAVDTISIAQSVDSNSKFLQFTIPFEQGKYDYEVEDIKPFLDSIQLNRFNIKEIDIKAYSSIEGNKESNTILQVRRAKSMLKAIGEYQLQQVETKTETFEDFDGFRESIKGSPYEKEFLGLADEVMRSKINIDTLGFDLEPYLAPQRRAEIRIYVESIYIDSLEPKFLSDKFRKALHNNDHIRAKALQTLMYRAVKSGELEKKVLFEHEINRTKDFIPLLNNRLAFQLEFHKGEYSDSLINQMRMEVEALLGADPKNGHVNFNKQAIKLYYWSRDLNFLVIDEENHIDQAKDFYKDIRKLYNTKIDNYIVNRLLMNYNIIAADFYYEKQDFRKRVKALKQVNRYVLKAKLNREETFVMARYFIFQMQIEWAIKIMQPFIKSGDYDADFMMTFLSIAVYDEKHVKKEKLYAYMKEASEKFPSEYCDLFGEKGMSEEFFTDLEIKSIYCTTCN